MALVDLVKVKPIAADVVLPSITALREIIPNNKATAFVLEYDVGLGGGGGLFVYDDSTTNIDDGIVHFGGWVRAHTSELSTLDAGLVGGSGEDVTSRLRALLAVAPDGCTVSIVGVHSVSGPVEFSNKANITIKGVDGGALEATTLRDTFQFLLASGWQYYANVVGSTVGWCSGILSWINCSGITVEDIDITGARKRFDQVSVDVLLRREYGDTGIQYRNSPNSRIRRVKVRNVWGWGIYGSDASDNSSVKGCYVYGCTMQSGIAIWNGCSGCTASGNTVDFARLYGLEIEVLNSQMSLHGVVKDALAYDNHIMNCKWGIALVTGINTASVYANTVENCLYGINSVKNQDRVRSIDINNNIVRNCLHSLHSSGSQNVHHDSNTCINTTKLAYVTANQYATVIQVESDRTKFRTFRSGNDLFPNSAIRIDGVLYTVVSRTIVSDPAYTYGESSYAIVTLSTALPDTVTEGAGVEFATEFYNPVGLCTSLAYVDDGYVQGVTFTNHTVTGAFYAYTQFNTQFSGSGVKLSVKGNKFTKTVNSAFSPAYIGARNYAWSQCIEWADNSFSVGLDLLLTAGGSTANVTPSKTVHFSSPKAAVTVGTAFPIHYFVDDSNRQVIGVDVVLTSVSSTEPVQLRLDGNVVYTVAAANPTLQTLAYIDRAVSVKLLKSANYNTGRHNVQLYTASNTANCAGYEIFLHLL